jgi:hypothetical protein
MHGTGGVSHGLPLPSRGRKDIPIRPRLSELTKIRRIRVIAALYVMAFNIAPYFSDLRGSGRLCQTTSGNSAPSERKALVRAEGIGEAL